MRSNGPNSRDAGLTLIELLIVLVVLPLLIGGVAAAFIVSVKTDVSVSARLSDSSNAQVGDSYFGRDVQAASEVTKKASLAPGSGAVFNTLSPEVCGPQTVLSSSSVPANETLLIALYRPVSGSSPALDVAYWLEGTGTSTKVNRYSCTLSATGSASSPIAVVISDIAVNPNRPGLPIATTAITGSLAITPGAIDSAASSGWTFTNPVTDFTGSALTLGSGTFSLTVPTTVGFTSGYLTVQSSYGLQTVNCTGAPTATTFSSCTGGSGVVSIGDTIHQASITSIQMTVSEPSSSYRYVLQGLPAGDSSGTTTCLGTYCPSPGLLILGSSGISLNGTGNSQCAVTSTKAKICVTTDVILDGGVASCTGGATIGATSIGSVSDPSLSSCDTGVISSSPFVPDPIVSSLPTPCFATVASLPTVSPPYGATLTPGIYQNAITGATLEPGVYVFEGGISGPVSIASAATTDKYFYNPPTSTSGTYDPSAGVLMYLPGNGYPSGCINVASPAGVTLSDSNGGNIAVAPLDMRQSQYWFGSPYLADMWIWQDVTDTQPFSVQGNVTVASTGLAYLPGSSVVTGNGGPSITTGRMIVGGVSLGGTPVITLTGS